MSAQKAAKNLRKKYARLSTEHTVGATCVQNFGQSEDLAISTGHIYFPFNYLKY